MSIFTIVFWLAALERAVKSAAQGAILAFGAGQANVLELDWGTLGGFAGGAFVLSLLTSIGSDALTGGTGPSLTNAEGLPLTFKGEHVSDERGASDLVVLGVVFLFALVILIATGVLR
jgi:hypothetical protein